MVIELIFEAGLEWRDIGFERGANVEAQKNDPLLLGVVVFKYYFVA